MKVDLKHGQDARSLLSSLQPGILALTAAILLLSGQCSSLFAQAPVDTISAPETTEQKIEKLTTALAKTQSQVDAYQQQLLELHQQLLALRQQMAAEKAASPPETQAAHPALDASTASPASLEEIQERQAIEESQIATHDVTKVETQSKYPLAVSGLLLFDGFVNTRQVDVPASPAYAIAGPGSTGLTLRQTVLGLDARGPHLFNATSHADLRVDFFANGAQSNYAAAGLLRLRTAHASLNWENTEAFVEVDRSILEPNEPSSLVAIAQPELAWSGDLWNWSPQIGASHRFALTDSSRIQTQAALIDSSDPPLPGSTTATTSTVTQAERSRWPGTEARIAFQHGPNGIGPEFGFGGYFSPHRAGNGDGFNAWAGTMDLRLPFTSHFEFTANAYRGQALAGLGGGGYVNYLYEYAASNEFARALDDVGGWTQLKARAGQKMEFNAGYGADNPFAKEIHVAMQSSGAASYPGLARNRSFFSNAIYSPSAYLLFSLEYKRLWTNYNTGPTDFSDSIGIGAGYKF
jgi:uncharacterized coiled-coil protein SlyX